MKPTCLSSKFLSVTLGALIALPGIAQQAAHRTVEVIADSSSGRLIPADGGGTIAVDSAQRYWADPEQNKILRGDAQGLVIDEVASGLNVPYGLGFDNATQSLVWTSSGDEAMQTLALSGAEVRTLNTNFDDPPVIEIAHEGGKQAITVVEGDVVRVTVDEITGVTTTEVLMSLSPSETVHGLAMDADAGALYVGNAVGMATYKISLREQTVARLTFTDHVEPTPDSDEGELQ
jgi:DNA-binding beta-propeller fold protein YncE